MLTGTIRSSRRHFHALTALVLVGIFGAIVYFSALSLAAHGREALNFGFVISAGIAILCAWKVTRDGWNWLHTIGDFEYDGAELRVHTLGSRTEGVYTLADIAHVQFQPHVDTIVLRDGGRLRIVHELANGDHLAEQLMLDLVPEQAASADPGVEMVRAVERSLRGVDADATRSRERWEWVTITLVVISAILFVLGFYFDGQKQKLSGVLSGYRTEQRGDRYFAVKHRDGPDPRKYEITEEQHRLWQEGYEIHGFFHTSSVLVFFVGWCIAAWTQRRVRRRPQSITP
jgi:hypothetical protein